MWLHSAITEKVAVSRKVEAAVREEMISMGRADLRSRCSRASFPMDLFLPAVEEGRFSGPQWRLVPLSRLTFCGFSILLDQEIEQLSPKDRNPEGSFPFVPFPPALLCPAV